MTRVVGVAGTWGWRADWWRSGSAWWQFMDAHGIVPVTVGGDTFEWNSGLGNSLKFWLKGAGRTSQWYYGGKHLRDFMDGAVDKGERVVVAHSHGGQAALFAASKGCYIDRLVTISTPVRKDMEQVINAALPNIGSWRFVYPEEHDRVAWWGGSVLFDGQVGAKRFVQMQPKISLLRVSATNGVNHSGLFNDASKYPLWQDLGLIDFLKGGTA